MSTTFDTDTDEFMVEPVRRVSSELDPARFLRARIAVDAATGCHVWQSSLTADGYGHLRIKAHKARTAHRLAYELAHGPVPVGLELDHLCRNRRCANPDHLEAVTHAENLRRGIGGHNTRSKTHCPRGHAYDQANTYTDRANRRRCRACWPIQKSNRAVQPPSVPEVQPNTATPVETADEDWRPDYLGGEG